MNRLANVFIWLVFVFSPAIAFASQQGEPASAFRGVGGLVLLIAYFTRKRACPPSLGSWGVFLKFPDFTGVGALILLKLDSVFVENSPR
jgi:hypothetical protein